jgi:hypothetical protein
MERSSGHLHLADGSQKLTDHHDASQHTLLTIYSLIAAAGYIDIPA